MTSNTAPTKPVAIVTGSSRGIGKVIAETLVRKGYLVYGTSRSPSSTQTNSFLMRALDVSDDESVKACIKGILQETSGRVDLLVSNAAIVQVSPEEELPLEVAQDMMNVNFFGAVRVTNAILPAMRKSRSGSIVLISSLAGIMGIPGQGFYCSTKHALEAYGDALYLELQQFGINVTLLEPGSYKTGIVEHTTNNPSGWAKYSDYEKMREDLPNTIREKTKKEGQNPQLVADLVVKVAAAKNPGLRIPVSSSDKRAAFFKRFLPEKMFYKTVGGMFGLE